MAVQHTMFSLLKDLKEEERNKLFSSSIFCSSVLKLFDQTTTSLIFELLIKAPSLQSIQNNKDIKETLKLLFSLGLITKKSNNLYLNETFRGCLIQGLCEIQRDLYFKEVSVITVHEEQENEKFVEILKFIANNKTINKQFGVLEILHYGKLVDVSGNITNFGFEFLLKSRKEQVWCLIILGLTHFSLNVDEQLNGLVALVELGCKTPFVVYQPTKPINLKFFKFLESLGLIFVKKNQIILNKFFREIFMVEQTKALSFITIETNFKLYAYTKSEYEISIIKLFSEVHLELPNLLKAMITEDSVNRAFEKGVKSEQIIHFLKSSIYMGDLPVTISNQIRLWETKRNRIQSHSGYLYSNFLNLIDFQKVYKFCVDRNCLIDKDVDKRVIIVKPEFNEIVKQYVKSII